jgi:RNA polymerase sigma factor (TIGR02999 family)
MSESEPNGQITLLLNELAKGNQSVNDQLIPLVYKELRKIAARHLALERPGHTLQPTALVHEAYIKLARVDDSKWESRAVFFAVAAKVMRNILVDYARSTRAEKRGGRDLNRVLLDERIAFSEGRSADDVIAVDEVLARLSEFAPDACRLVELRFFAGLSIEETAEVLNLSSRTVKRKWNVTKGWLYSELGKKARPANA